MLSVKFHYNLLTFKKSRPKFTKFGNPIDVYFSLTPIFVFVFVNWKKTLPRCWQRRCCWCWCVANSDCHPLTLYELINTRCWPQVLTLTATSVLGHKGSRYIWNSKGRPEAVTDPGMGGPGPGDRPPSPIVQNWGWSWLREAVCLDTGTSYHLNP